ncbi:RbsD/FucU domain-containing protein [Pedobacter lusitanus]|uniref:RbsD/FucU domain-containing protein n=1 Tax=Pedobacter lusitanus TaxID=1503925 RepID=UPI0009E57C85|nr:RbsD/FucU domain-containing protein [Pedobacter lusitanus]
MKIRNHFLKQLFLTTGISGIMILTACNETENQKTAATAIKTDRNWQQKLDARLPLLGHRNWILIVDKAFPEQNAAGMDYLYVDEPLLPVLKQVLNKLHQSAHIKPIIYRDKELNYISEDQAKGVKEFLQESKVIFGQQQVQSLLHEEVFKKLDAEAKLFKVLVIKTNETIPYTSVLLQLDCGYWDSTREKDLRERMK